MSRDARLPPSLPSDALWCCFWAVVRAKRPRRHPLPTIRPPSHRPRSFRAVRRLRTRKPPRGCQRATSFTLAVVLNARACSDRRESQSFASTRTIDSFILHRCLRRPLCHRAAGRPGSVGRTQPRMRRRREVLRPARPRALCEDEGDRVGTERVCVAGQHPGA